jgi:hypothetical protein
MQYFIHRRGWVSSFIIAPIHAKLLKCQRIMNANMYNDALIRDFYVGNN